MAWRNKADPRSVATEELWRGRGTERRKRRLGREEELSAIRRLDDQARVLERHTSGPSFDQLVAEEFTNSHAYGGRSVFGWEPPPEGEAVTTRSAARSG